MFPLKYNETIPGTTMSRTPIPGMNDATAVTAPHRIALGNPKMKNPMPVSTPYSAATRSDPRITEPARE